MFTARRYLALLPLALPRRDTSIGRYLNLSLSSSLCISPVLILLLFPFLFYQRSSTSSPPPPPPPQEENLEREELEEDALPVFLSCYLRRGIKPGQGGSSPLLSLSLIARASSRTVTMIAVRVRQLESSSRVHRCILSLRGATEIVPSERRGGRKGGEWEERKERKYEGGSYGGKRWIMCV